MHLQKKYTRKIQELEKKQLKSEEKIKDLKSSLSSERKSNKYNRRRLKEVTQSRENWKRKNKGNKRQIKLLNRQIVRKDKAARHQYNILVVHLCVMLRVFCGSSYRGVSKTIKALVSCGVLHISRCPSAVSVQNWVTKLGMYQRQSFENKLSHTERVLIVDESIRMGQHKQLLLLSTPYEKIKSGCLQVEDVDVHFFGGRTSWNGAQISEVINQTIAETGMVCKGVLSDEDSTLRKAATLSDLVHIPDICHAIGTCLRRTFEKNEAYQDFIKVLNSYRSKGVNSDLSHLIPPKFGKKARFLNLSNSIKWAQQLLDNYEQMKAKQKTFFEELPKHKEIIQNLMACINTAQQLSQPLKTHGVGLKILQQTVLKIRQLEASSSKTEQSCFLLFLKELSKYIMRYQDFIQKTGGKNIPVSSEVIESLFGIYKNKASANQLTGTTCLNFEMDVRCMSEQEVENKLKSALEYIFLSHLKEWNEQYVIDNQIIMRRKFFEKRA